MHIELLSQRIFMKIHGYIFMRVQLCGITNYALYSQWFNCIHVLHISDEIFIADLLRIAAYRVLAAEQVSQFLIFDQSQIIEHPHELFSRYEVAVSAIVVLERRLDKYAFAGDGPLDVLK